MNEETLAEIIANLNGWDPNDGNLWMEALRLARTDIQEVTEGLMAPWWDKETRT